MPLQLAMLGVVVEDMTRSVEFYRRLGLDLPPGVEDRAHVEVAMGPMTFFLNTRERHTTVDPSWTPATGGYRVLLEFGLGNRSAVDAKHAELVAHGYHSHRAPFDATPKALRFAMIDDPDGNTVLLSAIRAPVASRSGRP